MLPTSEWTVERMCKAKYAFAGTVDQVEAEFDALKRIGSEGELEWFAWFFDQGRCRGRRRCARWSSSPSRSSPPSAERDAIRHTCVKIEAHSAQQSRDLRAGLDPVCNPLIEAHPRRLGARRRPAVRLRAHAKRDLAAVGPVADDGAQPTVFAK
jgi:hypothetical protein